MSESLIHKLLTDNTNMTERIVEIEEHFKMGTMTKALNKEGSDLLEKVLSNSIKYRQLRYGN